MRVDLESFDRMYRREGDPWDFADSDYEQHRYRCSIQALHRVRYRRCFEPGCSIGVLTAKLADRCDEVIACDASAAAIEAARHRLAAHTNVELHTATLPEWWPTGRFDLVVFSELGYYWDVAELEPLVDRLADTVEPGGELLAVHWLGESGDHLLHGNDVHRILTARLGVPEVRHVETGRFVLERWTVQP